MTTQELTPDEAARTAAFDAAEYPAEVAQARIVEEVARAIEREMVTRCETCLRPEATVEDWARYDGGQGEHLCWDSGDCRIDAGLSRTRIAAAAAIAAYRATQDGGTVEAALTDVAEDLEWAATKQDNPDVALGFTAAAGRVRERLDDMRGARDGGTVKAGGGSRLRRHRACAEKFGIDGEYNPACCRFPKSCSPYPYQEAIDAGNVTEDDLEPLR
jgi:hypothetical protein